jgi:hypothetical protein
MMGELKQIKILSLTFFIIASGLFRIQRNTKKFCKALVGTLIKLLITQNRERYARSFVKP